MKKFRKVTIVIASICICLGIVVAACGAVMCSGHWQEYLQVFADDYDEEDYVTQDYIPDDEAKINSLVIDIGQGTVTLQPGEAFAVECSDVVDGDMRCYQSGSTWYVKQKSSWRNRIFSFVGVNHHSKVIITIPQEKMFKKVDIDLGAGSFVGSQISAEKLTMSIGAGEAKVESMDITRQADLDVGAGRLDIQNANAYDVSLDCGAGEAVWSGRMEGDSSVECGMGSIDLKLHGKPDNYEYSVDCGLGNINVNGKSYSSVNSSKIRNDNAENELDLECGMGKITVNIAE